MTIYKILLFSAFGIVVGGCVSKPFQPPPSMFMMFERAGATSDIVKEEMLSCGFPNVITGRMQNDSIGATGRRERCMFSKGFRYTDGYQGICSTDVGKSIAECSSEP